jgi:YidC/Oxa1 family membrane protein insertase
MGGNMLAIWSAWTSALEAALHYFSQIGLSEAAAIVCVTLIARLILMPISLTAAYRGETNKRKLHALKPQLDQLKTQFKDDPQSLMAATMRLHREHGIRFFDRLMAANIGSQSVFGIGFFQALSRASFASKFLWIDSLAKPDFLLTVAIGVLMYFGMVLMPPSGADVPVLMIVIPVLIAVITVALMPSSVGLYWATSNLATLGQTLALRGLMARHARQAAAMSSARKTRT